MHQEYEPHSYWHQSAANALEGDELPAAVDVAVVGAGLLGASTAYWLAREGARVALIERGWPAAGATGRNGGMMVAGTAEGYPQAVKRLGRETARAVWLTTLENRRLLRQVLSEEAIVCDYREPGHLKLVLGEEQLARAASAVALLHADGFAAELLDRSEAQAHFATPLAPEVAGAIFSPENGLLHPAQLVQGLVAAAQRCGTRLGLGLDVTQIAAVGAGLLLQTSAGSLRASAAVVAVNAWTGRLLPALEQLITPVRGQVLAYAPVAPLFVPGMSTEISATGEYWQQARDGSIILGGCRAVAPGRDVGVLAAEPTGEVQAALEQVLPRLFPALADLRLRAAGAGQWPSPPTTCPSPTGRRACRAPGWWAASAAMACPLGWRSARRWLLRPWAGLQKRWHPLC
jgi:glycine/D-amino acid oxidase-like deaminating enzyme